MIQILLIIQVFTLFLNSQQYEFKAKIGPQKIIMQLNNATNINITTENSLNFCWIQYQKLTLQKTIFLDSDDITLMNKYHHVISQQERIWVLMNDMILTQISHQGLILNQQKLNGTQNQFMGYNNEKNDKPIFFIDNQIIGDTDLNISKGIMKVLDGFLFVINKYLFIYDLTVQNNNFFGQIDILKYEAIVDFEIKKIDDKKYYFYILDKVYGLNILKLLLKQNNINFKQQFTFLKPDTSAKQIVCQNLNNCFAQYQNDQSTIQNFKINFNENSIFISEIYHSKDKIINLVNLGETLFIQHKYNHKFYIYDSDSFSDIQIIGLKQISQSNSTLFYAITQTKLLQFSYQISQPQVICQCKVQRDCSDIQNYQITYKEKNKEMKLSFSIEFEQPFENQLNAALATVISIIAMFLSMIVNIALVFLFVFWIYSLKAQLTCLEEKIKQGYAFMQKHKLPIFHTLENLAFTFRGAETLSKRIQQQESQEMQDTY